MPKKAATPFIASTITLALLTTAGIVAVRTLASRDQVIWHASSGQAVPDSFFVILASPQATPCNDWPEDIPDRLFPTSLAELQSRTNTYEVFTDSGTTTQMPRTCLSPTGFEPRLEQLLERTNKTIAAWSEDTDFRRIGARVDNDGIVELSIVYRTGRRHTLKYATSPDEASIQPLEWQSFP
jgi:hypothetical protein